MRGGNARNLEGPSTSRGEVSRDIRDIALSKSCQVFVSFKRTKEWDTPQGPSVKYCMFFPLYTHSMTARFVQL